MARAPLVVAKDLGKRYGDFIALHPLDVTVHEGEFFGVFGPNGAGKSTFIKLLTGQLRPSIGRAEVLGIDAKTGPSDVEGKHRHRSRIRESTLLPHARGIPADDRSLAEGGSIGTRGGALVGLVRLGAEAGYHVQGPLQGPAAEGDAGECVHAPPEAPLPRRALRQSRSDLPAQVQGVVARSREGRGTIFLCSHVLEMAERMCNRMAIIDHGRVLVAGTVRGLKESEAETLEDVFIRLVGRSISEGEEE